MIQDDKKNKQVWVKQVEPKVDNKWSYAVFYIDNSHIGDRYFMSEKISTLIPGAKDVSEYTVEDLFKDEVFKDMKGSNLELKVATGGGCRMVKLVPKK
ncbi:unnamed protein product [Oppiella nova]|uniref:Uncharacterized protein n=1 Tax=Oppiella nova TaxID=334625 RepID=A0A7R9R1B8_9ACAR|nr:unnamed protein product [Oppiella nova]CAG2182016.1 unnamed protein product [Oppiella nova]